MNCSKCGNENQEGSVFCNKCGNKIHPDDYQPIFTDSQQPNEELQNHSDDSIAQNEESKIIESKVIKKKNKLFITFLIVCCLGLVTYFSIKPPSIEETYTKVKDFETEKLTVYLEEVYPADGGFLGLFEEENLNSRIEVINLLIADIEDDFKSNYGGSMSDYNSVKISKVEIEKPKYNSDYVDVNVTVTNEGESSISYIKINLYFKDESGQIVKSDWTNDNSVIKPGASQIISNMTEKGGWKSVSAEIADIRW